MVRRLSLCGILAGILAVTLPMLASAQESPDARYKPGLFMALGNCVTLCRSYRTMNNPS